MFDDLREQLDWMNDQLLEEDEEFDELDEFEDEFDDGVDELGPGYNYAVDFGRTIFDDEESVEEAPVFAQKPRRKNTKGLRFLAILEIIGILTVIGWWLKWLV